jgi:4-amino-4-deoxy-L-arabinose transferase-like glycosyltransferase
MLRTAGRQWYLRLTLLSIAGAVAPVVWILQRKRHAVPSGDAVYFHSQASLIANGAGWFISPFASLNHVIVPSAQHPPLWVLVLSFADTIGITSFSSQLLATCVIGAGAVFVTGLVAREVGGPRAGLIAAAIAAVYPNYWMNDGTGLAETLVLLLVAAVLLASYRFWRRPSFPRAVWLGALCALAGLTRSEQLLLVVAVLIPVALVLRSRPWRTRLAYAGAGVLTALVVIAPWVGFNLARFSDPVFVSDDLGSTLAFANCQPAFYQYKYLGYGQFSCLISIKPVAGDESAQNAHDQKVALHYIGRHLGRLPVVMAARVGRELGLFEPLAQLHLDSYFDRRPLVPAQVGLVMYYGLLVGGVAGGLVLRRRRVTLVPMVGVLVEVVVAAMFSIGDTRYRIPLDVGLVVLSAVAVDALVTRGHLLPKTGAHAPHADATSTADAAPVSAPSGR